MEDRRQQNELGNKSQLSKFTTEEEVAQAVYLKYETEFKRQISLRSKSQPEPPPEDTGNSPVIMEPADGHKVDYNNITPDKILPEQLLLLKNESPQFKCIFCKAEKIDDVVLGPLYIRNGVVTHYYCMLFSAALQQKGKDSEGILGFLEQDIMKEARRSFRLKCIYCKKNGASIGCCNKKCKSAYHYSCGVKNEANFQFFGEYRTFCRLHYKKQKITLRGEEWECPICRCSVEGDEFPIMPNCCKNSVFHRYCLQKMALSAGYFFKCPACNCSNTFINETRSLGIYVPEQDASWERDNAFEDLYVQYSRCDAETCLCGEGRNFSSDNHQDWSLARCRMCGGQGLHLKCGNLTTVTNWACESCLLVEAKAKPLEKPKKEAKKVVVSRPRVRLTKTRPRKKKREIDDYDDEYENVSTDDEVCFRNIKITAPGSKYFPYTKRELAKFPSNAILPDWRTMTLKVHVWDLRRLVRKRQKMTTDDLNDDEGVSLSDFDTENPPSTSNKDVLNSHVNRENAEMKPEKPSSSNWSAVICQSVTA